MSHSPTRAMVARFWVRSAHDTDDELTRREAAACRRLDHLTQGFVSENEALFARWRLSVAAFDDLYVGAADTDGEAPDQDRSFSSGRAARTSRIWAEFADSGSDCQGFHWTSLSR